ncbi:MAG TPA: hypothetical protein VHQ96_06650, partial [Gaiellaceae bacterium]|nr:hypothetical protein [Gaiellaceae bacterium]
LHAQANQLGEATVLRLCDLLAVAVDDMRQGGDPRLPLELALVKVTRPAADLSRESIAFRLEQLEQRPAAAAVHVASEREPEPAPQPEPPAAPPTVELEQLQEAWQRSVIPAVEERSIPAASVLREAQPTDLAADTLTLEFPPSASFHRQLAQEPKTATLLKDALYQVTGRRLDVEYEVGEASSAAEEEIAQTEEEFVSLFKDTFEAHELEEEP